MEYSWGWEDAETPLESVAKNGDTKSAQLTVLPEGLQERVSLTFYVTLTNITTAASATISTSFDVNPPLYRSSSAGPALQVRSSTTAAGP